MKITIEEFVKLLGGNAKMAGPDDPIYKESPIILVTKKSKKTTKKKTQKLNQNEKPNK
tara:strand:- start:184 stop:357 length:174 start_codon:yes stop_codon:yes gene_type:complete